jgi:hypothetical protein
MLDWWAFHRDAVILTAVCAAVWGVVHEVVKYWIKKALGIPYK